MTIYKCSPADYPALAGIWERSVRASHGFLAEEHFQEIREALVPDYFPNVDLYAITDNDGPEGFIGLSDSTVEMLFIDSESRGHGYGSALVEFAVRGGCTKVDVNEQNAAALGFYLSRGFRIAGRDSEDSAGRPYPILHLAL